jgi:hypothetical protein
MKDYGNILGVVSNMDGTVNYIFLADCGAFVTWYLFERTWAKCVTEASDGSFSLSCDSQRADVVKRCIERFRLQHLHLRDVGAVLRRVRDAAPAGRLHAITESPDDVLRARLEGYASDLREMRPFLLRGFKPMKAMIAPGEDLVIAWDWSLRGLASLFVGESYGQVAGVLARGRMSVQLTVGNDGLLHDLWNLWYTTETLSERDKGRWLPENYLILEQFHEKLFGFYDKIDFQRIRSRIGGPSVAGELSDVAITLSIRDLAAADDDAGVDEPGGEPATGTDRLPPTRRIRPLRTLRLLNFLENQFRCEVRPGKGSEVVVHREGGRIFTLGHHRRNAEVSAPVVKLLLKRLGIGPAEWLRAVYG